MVGVVVIVADGAAVEVVAAAAVEVGGLFEPDGGRVRVLDPYWCCKNLGDSSGQNSIYFSRVIECSSEVSRTSMVFSATPS
jgi:hypothetical protein